MLSPSHIVAVVFHLVVKKDNLIGAMFTGNKDVPAAAVHERRDALRKSPRRRAASREHSQAYFASTSRAIVILVIALLIVAWIARGLH